MAQTTQTQHISHLKKPSTIFLVAGGTGGHVFPAVGMMETLQQQGYTPIIITDQRGKKYIPNTMPKNTCTYVLSMKKPKNILFFPIFIRRNITFLKLYHQYHPECLVLFGGYPTLCTVFSALLQRPKIIFNEQNAILGKSHRLFVRMACFLHLKIRLTLPWKNVTNIPPCLKKNNQIVTQTPVRHEFIQQSLKRKKTNPDKSSDSILLILGGSLGAKALSYSLAEKIVQIFAHNTTLPFTHIVHQVIASDVKKVQNLYDYAKIPAVVQSFFNDIPNLMGNANMIISRAGGSILSECSILQLKGIFIPYPYAKDHHQQMNAKAAKKQGLGGMILEKQLTIQTLHDMINTLNHVSSTKSTHKSSYNLTNKKDSTTMESNPNQALTYVIQELITQN